MPDLESVDDMAASLFCDIESDQGYAFLSDGEGFGQSREMFFAMVNRRLTHAREVVKIYERFLAKHNAG